MQELNGLELIENIQYENDNNKIGTQARKLIDKYFEVSYLF